MGNLCNHRWSSANCAPPNPLGGLYCYYCYYPMAIQVDGDRGDRCHADYRLKRGAEGAVDPADMAVLFFAALAARSAVCASVEGLVHSDRFPLSWSWAGGSLQQLWPVPIPPITPV